jgi:UDP:flavonoid glycosyltransferase YjiC (YdhE family)
VRVLFASTRGTGHFTPLVPFIEAALREGHEVLVVGPPPLAPTVEAAGYPFWEGANPPADELDPTWARVPQASPEEQNQIVVGEIFGRLNVRAMLPAQRAAISEWGPDLIIREQSEFASAIAAEEAGVRHARLGISLTALDRDFLAVATPGIEEQRAGIADAIWRTPYLTLFPAALDDPSAEQPPDVRRFRDGAEPASDKPLPDWWESGDERPLVYVSFGTVAGGTPMAGALFGGALAAVAGLEVRVLMTTGPELDIEAIGELPPNVHVESFVPQVDVLGHAALVVTHGGSGTMLGALAAGVPLVVVPLFADQPDNARRVEAVGAGVSTTPDAIGSAIETVLSDPKYERAALRMAQEIAWLPPADVALD